MDLEKIRSQLRADPGAHIIRELGTPHAERKTERVVLRDSQNRELCSLDGQTVAQLAREGIITAQAFDTTTVSYKYNQVSPST
jgi:hypothetical protein